MLICTEIDYFIGVFQNVRLESVIKCLALCYNLNVNSPSKFPLKTANGFFRREEPKPKRYFETHNISLNSQEIINILLLC